MKKFNCTDKKRLYQKYLIRLFSVCIRDLCPFEAASSALWIDKSKTCFQGAGVVISALTFAAGAIDDEESE